MLAVNQRKEANKKLYSKTWMSPHSSKRSRYCVYHLA